MSRHYKDFQLSSIEHFCLTVEKGSFTAAANMLGITPAAVSRSIARLEDRLNVRLFVRTTRQLRITSFGQAYYEQCRQALNQLNDAELTIKNAQSSLHGLIRISAPTPFTHFRLIPFLLLFQKKYPNIHIDIHSSNRNIIFSEDNFDIAIRGQKPKDCNLIARKLEDSELIVVATPTYLQNMGIPVMLEDLKKHNCIEFELPSTGRKILWHFCKKGKPIELEIKGNFTILDDFLATNELVKNHAGLMQVYRFSIEKELKSGELVEVLKEFNGATRPFFLLYPHAKYLPLNVRLFVDSLIEYMSITKQDYL